jgi:membrane-bound lytic murein transglycosylase D
MKARRLLALLLATTVPTLAQQNVPLGDLLKDGEQWLRENLDEEALQFLGQVDREKVEQLFRALQQRFQGDYVIDLAALQQTARALLPLLEAHEESGPYAVWLRTRLDYLDVAEEFRLTIPPPTREPGQPPKPPPNPLPDTQRKVWQKQLAKRPQPKAAHPYVPRLKPIFTAERVPAELVWVAEVESSFDPKARSPAGATGLYQLMPATAKQEGLSLWPRDERLQPEKSARAAAKYLRKLHRRFGDWRLALAAYNAGEGRIQSVLQKRKARTFDQIATHLPAETQMYVPKIEATLWRREGLTLAQLKTPAG